MIAKEGRIGACIDICLEMSSGMQTPLETEGESPSQSSEIQSKVASKEREGDDNNDTADLIRLEDEHCVGRLHLEDDKNRLERETVGANGLMD